MRVASIIMICCLALQLNSCRKDEECPEPEPVPVDGRDRFLGTYSVYDTLGTYLYAFTVSKFDNSGGDSLLLSNYADTFDLKISHERYWTKDHMDIGIWFPATDQAGHRWALFGASIEDGYNVLNDDTIRLRFTQDNIAFYFEDGVEYFSCDCYQIAVKSN